MSWFWRVCSGACAVLAVEHFEYHTWLLSILNITLDWLYEPELLFSATLHYTSYPQRTKSAGENTLHLSCPSVEPVAYVNFWDDHSTFFPSGKEQDSSTELKHVLNILSSWQQGTGQRALFVHHGMPTYLHTFRSDLDLALVCSSAF